MKPSVGRIVHVRSARLGDCQAGIVNGIREGGAIDVTVFPSTTHLAPVEFGIDHVSDGTETYLDLTEVPSEQAAQGAVESWHWPEREE